MAEDDWTIIRVNKSTADKIKEYRLTERESYEEILIRIFSNKAIDENLKKRVN